MDNRDYLKSLTGRCSFSRYELHEAMNGFGTQVSEASFKAKLQKLLASERIVRVGRNAYYAPENSIRKYQYTYSKLAFDVADKITENFQYIDFMVFETIQLNEFVNHQLAHNVVFVSVEGDLGSFVFDIINEAYPGKVLINPTTDIYHQYWHGDMVVVVKLVTEAPKSRHCPWAARLEKILVDIMADNLILNSISEAEYPNIYSEAFHKYVIDESCLFRYAKRRGVEKKVLELIGHKTGIQLRTRR